MKKLILLLLIVLVVIKSIAQEKGYLISIHYYDKHFPEYFVTTNIDTILNIEDRYLHDCSILNHLEKYNLFDFENQEVQFVIEVGDFKRLEKNKVKFNGYSNRKYWKKKYKLKE